MRQATVLVADDLSYSLNGKMNVAGIYTVDIFIPTPKFYVNQFVFLFSIDSDPDDPYQKAILSVTLPSGDKRVLELPLWSFQLTISECYPQILCFSLQRVNRNDTTGKNGVMLE